MKACKNCGCLIVFGTQCEDCQGKPIPENKKDTTHRGKMANIGFFMAAISIAIIWFCLLAPIGAGLCGEDWTDADTTFSIIGLAVSTPIAYAGFLLFCYTINPEEFRAIWKKRLTPRLNLFGNPASAAAYIFRPVFIGFIALFCEHLYFVALSNRQSEWETNLLAFIYRYASALRHFLRQCRTRWIFKELASPMAEGKWSLPLGAIIGAEMGYAFNQIIVIRECSL